MKRIILILTLFFCIGVGYSQSIQATLKNGTVANSIIVAIKPSVNLTNAKINTFNFSIAVPTSNVPRPVISILNNIVSTLSYTIETVPGPQLIQGVPHYFYDFIADGATGAGTERNYIGGADNNMIELSFSGGPLESSTIKIVSLPDGGSTFNSSFYIANLGTDLTNYTAMYYGVNPVNSAEGLSGLSYLNLAGVSLPTKFSNFLAVKKDDNAELSWTVDNEENNNYFDVQRSLDGRTFTDVIRVNALRNGRSSNTYNTPDVNISNLGKKVLYYRIKQVETSGEIVYSEVRQINLSAKSFTMALYPNPVRNITKLVVDAPEAGKAFVIVRDALGKSVQQLSMDFVKGINQKDLNATTLPAGEYNVTVMSDKFTQTVKMTKTN